MKKEEKKTSEEWQKLCTVIILDPDGWDRSSEGWEYSWYKEKITRNEFEKRMCRSTCQFIHGINSIWGDK